MAIHVSRRALVAGGSSGIGYACAELLLERGFDVVIVARGEAKLREAAGRLAAMAGREVPWVAADLATADGVERAAREASAGGTIGVLVNNGGGPKSGPFDVLSDSDWQHAVELNLMNTVRLTRAVLEGMRRQRWGRVINIMSTSVKQPIDNLMLSNAVRMAVVGFAKTLANEVGPDGVTVNTVAPGYTRTERLEDLAAKTAQREGVAVDEVIRRWAGDTPLRRIGEARDVAGAVAYLASDDAAYITGIVLPVDGGRIRASL